MWAAVLVLPQDRWVRTPKKSFQCNCPLTLRDGSSAPGWRGDTARGLRGLLVYGAAQSNPAAVQQGQRHQGLPVT